MNYAIYQTYTNHVSGEKWTRKLKKIYKTRAGAEKAAIKFYSWVTMPDGKNRTDESSAVVVETA